MLELALGLVLEPEPDPPPLLPQAATTSAALATMAAAAAVFVTECKKTTSLMGGTFGTTGHWPIPPRRTAQCVSGQDAAGPNCLRKP
jgi:hypothetical protein